MRTLPLILAFFILLAQESMAMECFKEHLEAAISSNRNRRGIYSDHSNSKSKKISNSLIFAEKISLIYAKLLSPSLEKYRRAGIPVLCLDFIEMSKVPDIPSDFSIPNYKYEDIDSVNIKTLRSEISKRLKAEDYNGIVEYIEEEISNKKKYNRYNCMVRHVLESLGRSAFLTPYYIEHASRLGLQSPQNLLNKYLRRNIFALKYSHFLDKEASSLQERGISILCGDVPHIPIRLDYEMELSKY
ncbi:hypothetical protein M902_0578 [Bacteriovorax sp. BAL6_X]|uniref:hypothetical protein n=1 Tax=Bacteriovorax sp. BAL6_X TaxID=1201290 RepID=UPI0003864673|nr:hypothetical protein [Bacteriovorax sp. BAL6_X]EPZ50018.1 hypothetical protein M902_0578 [Bacteriovorax sp. BAL6_X]